MIRQNKKNRQKQQDIKNREKKKKKIKNSEKYLYRQICNKQDFRK